MPGASCGRWAGPCSGPSVAPPNATRTPSPAGSSRTGPGSAKTRAARRVAGVLGMKAGSGSPAGGAHLGAVGSHPRSCAWPAQLARLSVVAMCCYRPDGRRARLAFHLQPGSSNDQLLIGVLRQLRRFLHGQKATLLWDGLRSHWSRPMRAFITNQRSWPVVERLPAYAQSSTRSRACGPTARPRAGQLRRRHPGRPHPAGPPWH
jgi:hypothetical protein